MELEPNRKLFPDHYHPSFMVHWWVLVQCGCAEDVQSHAVLLQRCYFVHGLFVKRAHTQTAIMFNLHYIYDTILLLCSCTSNLWFSMLPCMGNYPQKVPYSSVVTWAISCRAAHAGTPSLESEFQLWIACVMIPTQPQKHYNFFFVWRLQEEEGLKTFVQW
jgi:hypothetical protein